MQDIETLLNSQFTHELLALLEKYQDDPALIDSLVICFEMLLSQMPPNRAREIRRFAFSNFDEVEH